MSTAVEPENLDVLLARREAFSAVSATLFGALSSARALHLPEETIERLHETHRALHAEWERVQGQIEALREDGRRMAVERERG